MVVGSSTAVAVGVVVVVVSAGGGVVVVVVVVPSDARVVLVVGAGPTEATTAAGGEAALGSAPSALLGADTGEMRASEVALVGPTVEVVRFDVTAAAAGPLSFTPATPA
ncbi:MAG TPA: hypothetical protein VHV57_11930 [Acidimicrobiales bacterium]|nr:hypothetical protein [Acidimicrobiales bacterium]